MKKMILMSVVFLFSLTLCGQKAKYPTIVDNKLVLEGDKGSWDEGTVHTFSVVEANKDSFKYWGYYALDLYSKDEQLRKGGLARSNDLVHWEKYEHNPILNNNCRWPTVVLHDGVFYIFYAEYNEDNDSRIVMLNSKNGIDFSEKTVVVPYEQGKQNQNPFIYFDKNDSNFYLFYYNGVERADNNNRWNVFVRKSKDVLTLKDQPDHLITTSEKTLAAPSVAYYNNTYYLLVEEFDDVAQKWVTNAFYSDKVDKDYSRVSNNPILSDNDACAFQYVFNNELYVFYSHCINLKEGLWNLKMIKLK